MSTAVGAASGDTGRSPAAKLGPTGSSATAAADARRIAYWSGKARRAHAATARWLTVVRGRPPRESLDKRGKLSPQAARNLARIWRRRAIAASRRAHHPPQLRAWYCIHNYEGSWRDPNAPYWGGLQMDYSFQSVYGPWLLKHKGTANHWAPLAQIWTGVRAWRTRGFEPWAGSAHACGVY